MEQPKIEIELLAELEQLEKCLYVECYNIYAEEDCQLYSIELLFKSITYKFNRMMDFDNCKFDYHKNWKVVYNTLDTIKIYVERIQNNDYIDLYTLFFKTIKDYELYYDNLFLNPIANWNF